MTDGLRGGGVRGGRGAWLALLGVLLAAAALAQGTEREANAVEGIAVSGAPGGRVLVRLTLRQPLAQAPSGFAVDSPPRIAIDLPNTVNASGKNSFEAGEGDLRSMNLVQAAGRTRLVLNLARPMSYRTELQDRVLVLALTPTQAGGTAAPATQFAPEVSGSGGHAIRDVDFRRGSAGEGRIVVGLSDSTTGIDIRRQGRVLVISFLNTAVPRNLVRRLDVADFGTPVKFVDTAPAGSNVRMTIEPTGQWEHSAYQADNQFIVEVKAVPEDPNKLVQGSQPGYSGEKLSLNFQNVEIRSVLQVIADFTGLNIITSDTVSGNLTLRLKDVPWDQALDIILKSKGLDKRKNGNVILIAPKDELAAREKLELEAKAQVADLEPLVTESIKLKYQTATEVKKMLDSTGTAGGARILSKRGSAVLDARSNTLFVQDVPSRLEELRKLINEIDIAQRQVLIEARIVIADDKFSRQLGARFGTQSGFSPGNKSVGVSGGLTASGGSPGSSEIAFGTPPTGGGNLNVNLPVTNPAGALALTILNLGSGNLINVELSALETDGRGKVISSPRVITADKQEATIEQGTEIPYQQATSSGATNISFKPAVLSLKVTPQITPDDKIIMTLEVKKDSVGQIFSGVPSIDTKKVITRILVDNGETAVLGGIYEQTIRRDDNKVPWLGDIPVLGYLFKNDIRRDEKTELLIFITPKILREGVALR